MIEEIGTSWITGQIPLVTAFGFAVYWLIKRIDEKESIIKEKDSQLLDLSKDVIKVATLWEENKKDPSNKDFQLKVIDLLEEVKEIVNECRVNGKK